VSASWLGYLMYASGVLAAFFAWFLLLRALRKGTSRGFASRLRRSRSFQPVEQLLVERNYRFTAREWVGWAVVGFLMLAAPVLSYWLSGR
jgi:flagellar biosynthesis protein FliR